MAHYPPEELREFVRRQRRSFASSKALAREKDERERARIKTALLNLEREASRRRKLHSSPSAQAVANTGSETPTKTDKPPTPPASVRKGALFHDEQTSLGSRSACLNAPIPQSPLSEITNNCMASKQDAVSVSSVCAVGPSESSRTPERSSVHQEAPRSSQKQPPVRESDVTKVQERPSPNRVDPRLEPLMRALEPFVQSDEVFQRPVVQPSTRVHWIKEIAPGSITATKHSILPLLQTRAEKANRNDADSSSRGEPGNVPVLVNAGIATNECEKVAAQTQTGTATSADEGITQHQAVKSIWDASSDDDESHSSSTKVDDEARPEKTASEGGSYDVRSNALAETNGGFIENEKGCAWVLDINCEEAEERKSVDEPAPRAEDTHQDSTDSDDGDDYEDCTFFSESQA